MNWVRGVYVATVAMLVAAYFMLPDPPRLLWWAIGVLSVGAIAVGVRINRPAWSLPWWLLAAGTATFAAGDFTYDFLTNQLGMDNPFPSFADVLYLVSYPLWAAGLLLMVRARSVGSDRGALLDALIVTIGLGLLAWVFLAKPYVEDATLSPLEKGISVAYPLGDVLLLAVLARLLIGGAAQSMSVRLLVTGACGLLVADVLYGLTQLNGEWSTGGPVDSGWVVFYGLWGLAALDPDMVTLVQPVGTRKAGLTRPRLLLLASVSLIPPGLLIVEATRRADLLDAGVIALASAALFLLVTARLDGLIILARGSAQRERALRHAGESLVAASSREELYRASVKAVLDITGSPGAHRVLLALELDSELRVVHDSGADSPQGGEPPVVDVAALVGLHADDLVGQRFLLTATERDGNRPHSAVPDGVALLIAPMARQGGLVGAFLVLGPQVRRAGVVDAVCALGAQTLLAVESRTLIEQMLQQRSESHFRSLIQNASDVILVVDAGLRVVYQTPSVEAVLGYRTEDVQDQPVLDLFCADDASHAGFVLTRALRSDRMDPVRAESSAEWQVRHADGRILRVEVTCRNLLDDPSVNGLVLTLRDVTDRRVLEEELKHLAFHDSLTGLPNRALFLDRVEHALQRRGHEEEKLAVMLIDLDDFKLVNDTRGHATGDALLVAVAERLRSCMRAEDTAARLGGDEFAVLTEGLPSAEEARALAERVLTALRDPYGIADEPITVRASVGVATSKFASEAAELLRQADLAMYAAKDNGKGVCEFFHTSLEDRMAARVELRSDLERALDRDEFVLHYQPVVELASGSIVGVEALIRWQHPTKGLVMPGHFIDAVEETDLALPMGAWVLEHAVARASAWQREMPASGDLRMSVNVAPRQLHDPAFVGVVAGILARHGLPARSLTLEITERLLAGEDPQAVTAMTELRALGVALALDDFGTGYSALGYLRRFPVDALKIDRSFVTGIERSPDDRALVEAIVRLGETFCLGLVAEGIETEGQCEALVAIGCEMGQGYLFSKPVTEAELTALLIAQAEQAAAPLPRTSAA